MADPEWTLDEIRDLKRLYGSLIDVRLALFFNRPIAEITAKALELALSKNKREAAFRGRDMPRWSDDEAKLLTELYPLTPNLEIAKRLERSVKSIVSRARRMGLTKDPGHLEAMGRANRALRRPKPPTN